MKTVLLVAGLSERYYYDAFISACCDRRVQVFVFDIDRLPLEAAISIVMEPDGTIHGNTEVLDLHDQGYRTCQINIEEIDIAWYLRENRLETDEQPTPMEARFARNESDRAWMSIESVLPVRWINSRSIIRDVHSNKLYQQRCAAQCGFIVPWTWLSNDADTVIQAAEEQGTLLLKSIGYIDLDPVEPFVLYSERFSAFELRNGRAAIQASPVYAQQYVGKASELRVMCMGDHVLACMIDSQASEQTKHDWRHYDFEHVAHTAYDLPDSVKQKLLCFMQNIGLKYGAIDLILTPKGEYVFLEINPSGQWGWIADIAKLPVAAKVADMLAEA